MKKNRLLVASALVAVIGLAGMSVHSYDNYQTKQRYEQRQQFLAQQKAQDEASAAQLAKVREKCLLDLAAYNKLTPAAQAKVMKPICFVQTVQ